MQDYCLSGEQEHLTLFRHAHQRRRRRALMIKRLTRAATWLLLVASATAITWTL
jgi:hypothetical protein